MGGGGERRLENQERGGGGRAEMAQALGTGYQTKQGEAEGGDLRLIDFEERVRGLTALAGCDLNPEVLQVVLELVQLDVVPTAIAQVLKSLCNKARQNQK